MAHPASITAFMNGLIDYAGLFPPASLPLDQAIKAYHRYRGEIDTWMLSHFIIPASQLSALTTLVKQSEVYYFNPTACFSVLGRGSTDSDTYLDTLQKDLDDITIFRQLHEEDVKLDVFEAKLPSDLTSEETIKSVISQAADLLAAYHLKPFFEVPPGPHWEAHAIQTIETIAAYNLQHGRHVENAAGFKLRCGGVETSAFPSSARVASAIVLCRDAGIPMKATAGLHHPIRHYNKGVQTKMHGFINVFGAGILAQVHTLSMDEIQAILEDETPGHFIFSGDTFTWQNLQATTDAITQVRNNTLISYGSCSFDEPREDLQALKFM